MFQLEQRYVVPQHGNTVRLLPSALPPRLTNEARGANRAAHERWDREIYDTHIHTHAHTSYTHVLMQKNEEGRGVGVGRKKGRAPQPCCLNSLQKACDSSPFSPSYVPQEQPAGCFTDKEQAKKTKKNIPDARVKILQKLI